MTFAVLDPHTTTLDRRARRAASVDASSSNGPLVSLRSLWAAVARGMVTIEDAFLTEQRAVLVTAAHTAARRASDRRNLSFLRHALESASVTAAAIDHELSMAAGSMRTSMALRIVGVAGSIRTIPLPVVLLAHAASCPHTHLVGFTSDPEDPRFSLLHLRRPDWDLRSALTPCEWRVVQLLVEAKPYEEIALARNASVRTVANQIASAFRKLRVSGRLELLRKLACPEARASDPASSVGLVSETRSSARTGFASQSFCSDGVRNERICRACRAMSG
ncbi:MAG TPA: helix-turn-helix transcriptional regulator [Polyangiaceae bacterium]